MFLCLFVLHIVWGLGVRTGLHSNKKRRGSPPVDISGAPVLDQRMFGAASERLRTRVSEETRLRGSKDAGSLSRPRSQEVACQRLPGEGLLCRPGPIRGERRRRPSPNIGDLAGVILADSEHMYNTSSWLTVPI